MNVKTPNYALTEAYSCTSNNGGDYKVLDAGTFVRPIELRYVPKHVVEDHRWRYFNPAEQIFCFTSIGIVPIPRDRIQER